MTLEVGIISVSRIESARGIKNFLAQFGENASCVTFHNTRKESGFLKVSSQGDIRGHHETLLYFKKGEFLRKELTGSLSSIKRENAQSHNPKMELLPFIEEVYRFLDSKLMFKEERRKIDADYFGKIAETLYECRGDAAIPLIEELSVLDASQIMLRLEALTVCEE
jgi:hypothetical protein